VAVESSKGKAGSVIACGTPRESRPEPIDIIADDRNIYVAYWDLGDSSDDVVLGVVTP
jgi:hypothetical protein